MQFMTQTNVLVLLRSQLISAGVVSTLQQHSDLKVIDSHNRSEPGVSTQERADVVIADYDTALEIVSKERLASAQRGRAPTNVLIVTRCETEWQVRHALEEGVRGYLLLDCSQEEVADAVRTLHRGGRYLGAVVAQRMAESLACVMPTGRELEVLRLLARGHVNKVIASKLDIAIGTVKSHVRSILQKMNASTRTEAAALADRRGLLTSQLGGGAEPAELRRDWRPRHLSQPAFVQGSQSS